MRLVLTLLMAVWVTAAAAQVPFGRESVVETRFGSLQVLGGDVDNFLFFDGLTYEQIYATQIHILAAAGLADAQVDWALIEAPQGHNQCERIHRLLALTPAGLSFSQPFGPCNGQPVDMQIAPGQVQVTLTGDGGVSGTYTFDGQELHEGTFATAPPPPEVVPTRLAQSANVSTRFGRLWLQSGQWDQTMIYDGAPLPVGPSEFYWYRGVYEGQDRDYVIASSNHSGNMCGGYGEWFLISVGASGPTVAQPLDACTNISNVRVSDGALQLDMSHRDLTISHEVVRWDGASLTRDLVPAVVAAPAGAGEDVTRWIGRYTYEIFADASERARLGQIMSTEQIQELAVAMSIGGEVVEQGGWVVAQSCQQHNCGYNRGIWAVRIADGAAAAVLLQGDPAQVQEFGLTSDPVVAAAIAEQQR